MKIFRKASLSLIFGIVALAFSSCAYDPFFVGGGNSGFGDGRGFGYSGFNTTAFVSTGNARWRYDPLAGAYYDFNRRAYYDPHLFGYYPVGFRPRYVIGAPHPFGWNRGRNFCPPPSRIRSQNLRNFRDRGARYQSLGRDWSRNVRINNSQGRNFSNSQRSSFENDRIQRRADFSRNRNADQSGNQFRNQSREQRQEFRRGNNQQLQDIRRGNNQQRQDIRRGNNQQRQELRRGNNQQRQDTGRGNRGSGERRGSNFDQNRSVRTPPAAAAPQTPPPAEKFIGGGGRRGFSPRGPVPQ